MPLSLVVVFVYLEKKLPGCVGLLSDSGLMKKEELVFTSVYAQRKYNTAEELVKVTTKLIVHGN